MAKAGLLEFRQEFAAIQEDFVLRLAFSFE